MNVHWYTQMPQGSSSLTCNNVQSLFRFPAPSRKLPALRSESHQLLVGAGRKELPRQTVIRRKAGEEYDSSTLDAKLAEYPPLSKALLDISVASSKAAEAARQQATQKVRPNDTYRVTAAM